MFITKNKCFVCLFSPGFLHIQVITDVLYSGAVPYKDCCVSLGTDLQTPGKVYVVKSSLLVVVACVTFFFATLFSDPPNSFVTSLHQLDLFTSEPSCKIFRNLKTSG